MTGAPEIQVTPEMVEAVKSRLLANTWGDGEISQMGIEDVIQEGLRDALALWLANRKT